MQSIIFTCEIITPIFMSGADGVTPELRAPSIKGVLRFWWRAMHAHLDLETLKKTESDIFGSTAQKSRFSIRIVEKVPLQNTSQIVLPHRTNSFAKKAIQTGQQFQIIFYCMNEKMVHLIQHLFPLCCVLSGFGGRSRRGFGNLKIVNGKYPHSLIEIHRYLEMIVPNKFILIENAIEYLATRQQNYPYIEKIEMRRADLQLVKKIGQVTHDTKMAIGNYDYSRSLGSATPRFASPIYVSALVTMRGLQSIVVMLHTPQGDKNIFNYQNQFKETILK
jgi:CRISPR-associated protein Cmr1